MPVMFVDLTEVTVEDMPIDAEYAEGDAVVCLYDCCKVLNPTHLGRVIYVHADSTLTVHFHDRVFSEIIRESKVRRYV